MFNKICFLVQTGDGAGRDANTSCRQNKRGSRKRWAKSCGQHWLAASASTAALTGVSTAAAATGAAPTGAEATASPSLAIILIISNYERKTCVILEISKYSEGRRVLRYDHCPKASISFAG